MTLTEQKHPAGTFPICGNCQREPLHIVVKGRSTKEPINFRIVHPPERHVIECCRCKRLTAMHFTLAEALVEWTAAYVSPLPAAPIAQTRAA